MSNKPLTVARACLQAYVSKDRVAIEALLHEDCFGWNLPHQVPTGKHADNEGQGHA